MSMQLSRDSEAATFTDGHLPLDLEIMLEKLQMDCMQV
jgi:hypothetical protein